MNSNNENAAGVNTRPKIFSSPEWILTALVGVLVTAVAFGQLYIGLVVPV